MCAKALKLLIKNEDQEIVNTSLGTNPETAFTSIISSLSAKFANLDSSDDDPRGQLGGVEDDEKKLLRKSAKLISFQRAIINRHGMLWTCFAFWQQLLKTRCAVIAFPPIACRGMDFL
jgi:hypothetical protein